MMNQNLLTHQFHHCPRCGSEALKRLDDRGMECPDCGFRFYINPGIATGALIANEQGALLLIRRAKDPGRGKLGIPGGFVEINEMCEAAVLREVREEVGLECRITGYVCSHPNDYIYRDVRYPILDFFYTCEITGGTLRADPAEVSDAFFVKPESIDFNDIAFPSIRHAIESFIARKIRRE